jgi:hypothetical protein
MPTARIIFHRLAIKEYRSARAWYKKRSPRTAERFCAAVDHATERAAADFAALSVLAARFRSIRVKRFPYQLILEAKSPSTITVLAVAHTSRRTGYWRHRK